MNNIYLRNKDNLKTIIGKTILALFPLLLAGFYKNGIKLYLNNLISIYAMFKPIIYDIIGFLIGLIVNILYERIIKKQKTIKEALFSSYHPLYGLLIASVISINTNIFLFIGVTFITLFISKFFEKSYINIIALTALITIFITNLTGHFTYLNIYEQNNKLNLVALDYLIGRGSGGINTSHVLLLIISILILCNIKTYKKEIPLYSGVIYNICMIVYCIVTNNIGYILENIFANGILFSFVFIATDSPSSSYTMTGRFIYSLIIGIVTFALYLIYPPLSALGGIIIASICHDTIDRIVIRIANRKNKYNKKGGIQNGK